MQITDDMVKRAAMAHHFACLQDAGLPADDLAYYDTPEKAWEEADDDPGDEELALKHMRAALEAVLAGWRDTLR